MIRTVSIPNPAAGRIGCARGAGCCSDCGDHAETARIADVQCDQDGNCYTNGVLTAAPLTYPAGVSSGLSTSTVYIIGAAVFVGLLELFSRRR